MPTSYHPVVKQHGLENGPFKGGKFPLWTFYLFYFTRSQVFFLGGYFWYRKTIGGKTLSSRNRILFGLAIFEEACLITQVCTVIQSDLLSCFFLLLMIQDSRGTYEMSINFLGRG